MITLAEGPKVGGDADHVVFAEVGNDFLHQRSGFAGAGAVLQIEQLAGDVLRLQSGYARNLAQTLQVVAVAESALAALDERLAFRDAAGGTQAMKPA